MTKQNSKEQFRDLGFRCIAPTQVQMNGSPVTVTAFWYMIDLEKEYPECTQHEKRAWKFYSIVREKRIELISELELEKRIGTDAFNQLPIA